MFTPCNISDFRFTPCKKTCLDSNSVIWRLFDFGPSWHQSTKFKVLSPLAIWENFGLPPAISSIFRFTPLPHHRCCTVKIHFKLQDWNLNNFFTGDKPKIANITGVNIYQPLIIYIKCFFIIYFLMKK